MTYVYEEPVEFKLREKLFSLTGDGFSINREDTDESLFKVSGNVLSLRESKTLYAADGSALYKMTDAMISLRSRMYISDERSGDTVVTLRKKGFIPMLGTSTILVWKGSGDDGEPWLEVHGSFFRKDFKIKEAESGKEVGRVKRKAFNIRNIFMDKDTYVIRVEPGYDAALLVFLVIAIDEQYHEKEEEEEEEEGGDE